MYVNKDGKLVHHMSKEEIKEKVTELSQALHLITDHVPLNQFKDCSPSQDMYYFFDRVIKAKNLSATWQQCHTIIDAFVHNVNWDVLNLCKIIIEKNFHKKSIVKDLRAMFNEIKIMQESVFVSDAIDHFTCKCKDCYKKFYSKKMNMHILSDECADNENRLLMEKQSIEQLRLPQHNQRNEAAYSEIKSESLI